MRHLSIIASFIVISACSTVSSPSDKEVPKAFEEDNQGSSFKRYGGGGDVVNSMYSEIVSDDAGLKSLEKSIGNLPDIISDAQRSYRIYNENNNSYYNSAMNHVNMIRDETLKAKIKAMVEASRSQYNTTVAKHNKLIQEIDWKRATLEDAHTFLKLVKTLPAIEAYQKRNMPSTTEMENASGEIDKLVQRTKEASKQ